MESTLGQVYKEKINGEYRGGPAFYIEKGLGMKWYAWTFAIATIFACGVLLPGQANSIGASLQTAFDIDPNVTAAGLALLLGFIIFGGVKRIANFASTVVPFMALGYIIVACVIIALNIHALPGVILLIWKSAFGFDAGFGAILGLAIMWGSSAGLLQRSGSGYRAARLLRRRGKPPGQTGPGRRSRSTSTPCSSAPPPALCCSSPASTTCRTDGAALYTGIAGGPGPGYVQTAMESMMPGFGSMFVAIALFFFAFTTIVAYYYIAETNIAYINRKVNRPWLTFVLKLT